MLSLFSFSSSSYSPSLYAISSEALNLEENLGNLSIDKLPFQISWLPGSNLRFHRTIGSGSARRIFTDYSSDSVQLHFPVLLRSK
ncbi:hypothetical protein HS088_TW08G00103 [Tripterygium wilfordii]|uniref:Uncharacterized protein n=1 Tax=Tripterygium wilfordii TaxID=458696 RepID=A0A7J7DB80_TRIWF|nr:hypothetical protein HS088_TW08G00103 [Tripterygium wilfordii]